LPPSPSAYAAGIVDSHGVASAAESIIPVAMTAKLFAFGRDIWIRYKLLNYMIF
jgi:hypothetical protein